MGKRKTAVVIGAGFGGLSAAAFLARAGYQVTVIEQCDEVGGRAQVWQQDGFHFDIGPSWYWMPDEHDAWFEKLGAERRDYYAIERLDPSFRVFFDREIYDVPSGAERVAALFGRIEPGAERRLDAYLARCRERYEVAKRHFIFRSYRSIWDMVNPAIITHWRTISLLQSYERIVRRYFRTHKIMNILSYPVVFLGSEARRTPAVYTLMNWLDIGMGTWYPLGGFGVVVRAMRKVGESLGVRFLLGRRCSGFTYQSRRGATAIMAAISVPARGAVARASDTGEHERAAPRSRRLHNQMTHDADVVVANGDYYAVEQLLPPRLRSYSERYWHRRRLAPGVMNFFLGLDTVIPEFQHHTFFFDGDWSAHFAGVYRTRAHVEKPVFYLHYPTATDPATAPAGCSALYILIPIAAGSDDSEQVRMRYFDHCCRRIEQKIGRDIRPHIRIQRSMSISEFTETYSAFQGNAFGLGHTLLQTAAFRPRNASRRIRNLYYCGQYTIPGTGTTMSMISGEVTAARIVREQGGT